MGCRESGAFLLGKRSEGHDKVITYCCYDDVDPHALERGYVAVNAVGFAALWSLCRKTGLEVLADVHTHPGDSAAQSSTDSENPMIPQLGHVALIVPGFAKTSVWRMRDVGVYEYLGNYSWRKWTGRDRSRRVQLCLR